MKKKIFTSMIFLAGFTFVVYAINSGGSQSDPIVTQSSVETVLTEGIDNHLDEVLSNYEQPIEEYVSQLTEQNIDRICFVENDVITLDMGDSVIIRTGTYTLSGIGSLINVQTGAELTNPTQLAYNTEYIVAENSNFELTVTSLNSLITVQGDYSYSNIYTVSYLDYANALYNLGLFKGSSYGYQLDRPSTRVESLVMFIRLIGEEDEALAYDGTHAFTDVPAWAESYVAYAYNKGYTNGMTATEFGSDRDVRDLDYYTFILRALGYADNVDFTWATAYEKAIEIGIIPADFESYYELYRDHLVFISYNALELKVDEQSYTLAELLIQNETINAETYKKTQETLG